MSWFRRRREDIFDYGQVLSHMEADLLALAKHIRKHDFVVDAQTSASQIEVAVAMLRHAKDYDGPEHPGDSAPEEVQAAWAEQYMNNENEAWDMFWDYLKAHMRKWWD